MICGLCRQAFARGECREAADGRRSPRALAAGGGRWARTWSRDPILLLRGGRVRRRHAAVRPRHVIEKLMAWLVGAVGIELLFHFTKSRVFTVLPTASQMNWSQMELTNTKARSYPCVFFSWRPNYP